MAAVTAISTSDSLTASLVEHDVVLSRLRRTLDALKLSLEREARTGGYATPVDQHDYTDAVALLVECGELVNHARERAEIAHAAWAASEVRR